MTKENHVSIWRFAISDIACLALGIILGALAAFAPINARAADLPPAKIAPAPLPVPASSWTGLYFGASGGYAFDFSPNMNLEAYNSGVGTTFQPYAYASGASAALSNRAFVFNEHRLNYQAGSWVLGAEASLDLPVGGDTRAVTFATPGLGSRLPSRSSARAGPRASRAAKLGFMLTPQFRSSRRRRFAAKNQQQHLFGKPLHDVASGSRPPAGRGFRWLACEGRRRVHGHPRLAFDQV